MAKSSMELKELVYADRDGYTLHEADKSLTVVSRVVYHGSPAKFDVPIPHFSLRSDGDTINWSGFGVFATYDRRVALTYTGDMHETQCYHGVDLVNITSEEERLVLYVGGGKSEQDALDQLYGPIYGANNIGYIYCLDDSGFTREGGLGEMEVVSRTTPVLVDIQSINRRAEIEKYIRQGLMQISWDDTQKSMIMHEEANKYLSDCFNKLMQHPIQQLLDNYIRVLEQILQNDDYAVILPAIKPAIMIRMQAEFDRVYTGEDLRTLGDAPLSANNREKIISMLSNSKKLNYAVANRVVAVLKPEFSLWTKILDEQRTKHWLREDPSRTLALVRID